MAHSIAVFVKRSGILVACKPHPAPDGATWQCGVCGFHPIMRASYGVMSGLWRCNCGAELELLCDGVPVPIEEVSEMMPAPFEVAPAAEAANAANVPAKPRRKRTRKLNDTDFLRECGIADPEEPSNA